MHNRDIFSIFCNMMVCCVYSIELPHRGDFNECIQHTISNIKKTNYPKSAAKFAAKIVWDFSKGLKSEFEIVVVNEPRVFEPLKFNFNW